MSDQTSMSAAMRSTPGGLHLTISDRPDADRFEAQLDGPVVGWQLPRPLSLRAARSLLQPISRPDIRLVITNPGSRPRHRQGDLPTP